MVKVWNGIFSRKNGTKEQSDIVVLITDKVDFKLKLIREIRKKHFLVYIKAKIEKKNIANMNITNMHLMGGDIQFHKRNTIRLKATD